MKISELTRMLKKAGCFLDTNGANHEIWYSPLTGKRFCVPRHHAKEIPNGTADRINRGRGLFKPRPLLIYYPWAPTKKEVFLWRIMFILRF